MSEVYLPLVSALLGAIIGAASSVVTIYIQTRVRDRRERLEQASRMAIETYRGQIEIARLSQRPTTFMPLVSHFAYHWDLVQLLDSGAELNEEALRKLNARNEALWSTIHELDKLRRSES
jgi:hypothetical protein